MLIRDILEEHAEEAAFLWLLRERAVWETGRTLDDLRALEARIDAHLDGLLLAGGDAWDVVRDALPLEDAGEVFVVGMVTLRNGREDWFDVLLQAVDEDPSLGDGAAGALAWERGEVSRACLDAMLRHASPVRRRVALCAYARGGENPGSGLGRALSAAELGLRRSALRYAGELGRKDLLPLIVAAMGDADCSFEAARSAGLLGDTAAADVLMQVARAGGEVSCEAAALASRLVSSDRAMAWQRVLAGRPATHRAGLAAAGAVGDPVTLPWVIMMMKRPEMAGDALAAFRLMTGFDPIEAGMVVAVPPAIGAGDDGGEMDDVDGAEVPDTTADVERIMAWWRANESRFVKGKRYFRGEPISTAVLIDALAVGAQPDRGEAALELACSGVSRPLFPIGACAARQDVLLRQLRQQASSAPPPINR